MGREKTWILSVLVAALILVEIQVSFGAIDIDYAGTELPWIGVTFLFGAEIVVLSPQNLTYATRCGDVPLIFTMNETTYWMGYSLDGQATVTISGNTTLASLSYGDHYVTVYASDTNGYVSSSDTVHFRVILGDVDGDCDIDGMDLFYMAAAYGKSKGDYYYDSRCDLDNDGDVDSMDLFTLAAGYPYYSIFD